MTVLEMMIQIPIFKPFSIMHKCPFLYHHPFPPHFHKERMELELQNLSTAKVEFSDKIDSCCATPYVRAPSSPGNVTSALVSSVIIHPIFLKGPKNYTDGASTAATPPLFRIIFFFVYL